MKDAQPIQAVWAPPAGFDCLVAHNAAFDFSFLDNYATPVLCTKRLAQKLWPDFPSHSNQYLRYRLALDVPECEGLPAHSALPDALVTAKLLAFELQALWTDLPSLIAWVNEPIIEKVCRFGKHKGTPWAEVPKSYLQWMLREIKDMDADQQATVNHYLTAR